MRKIVGLLIFIVFIFSMGTAFAEDMAKPKLVVLFNDSYTESQQLRQEAKQIFFDNLTRKFSSNYNVIINGGFSDKLAAIGVYEPILAEREDLIPVFKAENVDFVIVAYGSNYAINGIGSGGHEYLYYIQLKAIDVKQNKSLVIGQYNVVRSSTTQLQRHIGDLYIEIEKALVKAMPLLQK